MTTGHQHPQEPAAHLSDWLTELMIGYDALASIRATATY
jgi:hypothetical protein